MPSAARKKKKTAPARKKDSRTRARSAKPVARKPAPKVAPRAPSKAGKTAPVRAVPAPPAKIAPGSASRNIPLPAKPAAMPPGKGGAAFPGKGTAVPGRGMTVPGKGGAAVPGRVGGMGGPGEMARPGGRPAPRPGSKKGGRKSPLSQRRGPNGEPFVPGDLLLPTGPQGPDEVQYLLRGSVAAEHAAGGAGVSEIIIKKGGDAEGDRQDLTRYAEGMAERFEKGSIEPLLPSRPQARRNFAGVVERAKHRRREIGAFLRGLDLGRTETSHMDSHGEASLQSLMEWAARLENLAEADEPERADFAQLHRGLDQLESKTEELIVDVELTLRRLRDRLKTTH
jgi:hypothetical protein